MSMSHVPAVFVSSTCYDLNQVRSDLRSFIINTGFEPVLSEYDSFPVDPTRDTIDNCRRAVQDKADIFVLIIGARLGSTDLHGKSITNLEYLQASAKGIPVYAFIRKSILDLLPAWRKNPNVDFKDVDSPKLFEFISSIRDSGTLWTFPFDTAQDITTTLRMQWAYLFSDALDLWKATRSSETQEIATKLRGRALQLLIERPFGWEYLLFSQRLQDNIVALADRKRDCERGLIFPSGRHVSAEEFSTWMLSQFAGLMKVGEAVDQLLNKDAQTAFGAEGCEADANLIVYVADRIGDVYRYALDWSLGMLSANTDDIFDRAKTLGSGFSRNMVNDIETFSSDTATSFEVLSNPPGEDEKVTISLCLELSAPEGMEEFEQELERVARELGFDLD